MTDAMKTKLGKTRAGERTRVWIEGDRLLAHGFKPGSKFLRKWTDDNKLVLTACTVAQFNDAQHGARGTVASKGKHPIIDIIGQAVAEHFKGTHVSVTYATGKITISDAGK
jgi:hypothetical protein